LGLGRRAVREVVPGVCDGGACVLCVARLP
jgi:hypothetical protein